MCEPLDRACYCGPNYFGGETQPDPLIPNSEGALATPLGGAGHWSVPSGGPPLGMGKRTNFSMRLFPVPTLSSFRPANGWTAQAGRLCYPFQFRNSGSVATLGFGRLAMAGVTKFRVLAGMGTGPAMPPFHGVWTGGITLEKFKSQCEEVFFDFRRVVGSTLGKENQFATSAEHP